VPISYNNQQQLKIYRSLVEFLKTKGQNQTLVAEKIGKHKSSVSNLYGKKGEKANPELLQEYIDNIKNAFPNESIEFEAIQTGDPNTTPTYLKLVPEEKFRAEVLKKLDTIQASLNRLTPPSE